MKTGRKKDRDLGRSGEGLYSEMYEHEAMFRLLSQHGAQIDPLFGFDGGTIVEQMVCASLLDEKCMRKNIMKIWIRKKN